MHKYVHIPLHSSISVDSLVSVYHRELHNHFEEGEQFDFCEIFYVESGVYSMYLDDKLFTVNPGQMLFFAPNTFHRSFNRNNATISIVTFSSSSPALKALYNQIFTLSSKQREMLRDIVTMGLDTIVWSREFEDYGFYLKEGTDALTVQELKNKLELLLISLCKKAKSPESYNEKFFSRLTDYLNEHICEKLTLNDIADHFSISVSKLKSICASQRNTSPIEFFISLKLNEAKRMMAETNLNISQISNQLGFSSIHYFSKLFKNKNGISPSQYAKVVERDK